MSKSEIQQIKQNYPKELWDSLIKAVQEKRQLQATIEKEPTTVGPKLVALMADMKKASYIPGLFGGAHRRLWEMVTEIESKQFPLAPEYANPVADDFIDLFLEKRNLFSYGPHHVGEFVARYGSSPKAKKFVLAAIAKQGKEAELHEQVINNLYWGPAFRGDLEVAGALGALFANDPKEYAALAAMAKVNVEQAAPIIKATVDKSTDVATLNKMAGIISSTHHVGLLRYYMARVEQFPAGGGYDHDPAAGIYDGAMATAVEQSSGKDLVEVLSFMSRRKAPGIADRDALLAKLNKEVKVEDRRAVAESIAQMAESGRINAHGWLALIKGLAPDPDARVQQSIERTLAALKGDAERMKALQERYLPKKN